MSRYGIMPHQFKTPETDKGKYIVNISTSFIWKLRSPQHLSVNEGITSNYQVFPSLLPTSRHLLQTRPTLCGGMVSRERRNTIPSLFSAFQGVANEIE